jgi:hypothetical protein
MIKKLIYSLVLILLMGHSWKANAQARVEASLDTTMMLIGDHIEYSISATVPLDANVTFPVIQDTLVDKIEVLRDLPFDTILKDGTKTIRKPWIITSFDSGSYIIKPRKVAITYSQNRTDTLHTNPLYMGVITFNIDSTANAVADIKKPIDTPLTFKEFLHEYAIWYGLIFLILALVFTLWWYFKKQQKKKEALPEKPRPKEPPHVIALRELDELSGKKLWQQDKIKLHYSILSDIVRQYLEYRFDVPAMENTTGFIEEWIEDHKTLNKENQDKVKDILEMADLAKFAKFTPLPDDNSRTLDYAYQLVISTKERIVEPEQPKETEENEV